MADAKPAVQSMTGSGTAAGDTTQGAVTVECRSVNGRGLDVRVRAPSFIDQAERAFRQEATARFKRGSIQATLTVEREGETPAARLDKSALAALLADLADLGLPTGAAIFPIPTVR